MKKNEKENFKKKIKKFEENTLGWPRRTRTQYTFGRVINGSQYLMLRKKILIKLDHTLLSEIVVY